MNKSELQQKLKNLEEEEKSYQFIKDASYPTKEELTEFQLKYKDEIKQLNQIIKEKKNIEWEMMTEQERKEYEEMWKKIVDKHEGE